MKRLLTLAAVFLCCAATSFAQYSGSGNGTEDDPYLVFNENQLSQMVNFLDQEGVVFKLMKDLNLTTWISENNPSQGWLPVGVESSPFKGKFYGNNHTISGLMINRSSTNHVGFFGYVSGATINDLTIEGTTITGSKYVGGMFGYISESSVTNCHVVLSGAPGVSGMYFVGGFSGYSANSNFSTFSVNASSSPTFRGYIGGFIGQVEGGTFSNGNIIGNVTGILSYVGGLFGIASNFTVNSVTVKGNITGNSSEYIGGIVGLCVNGNLTNCYYEGELAGVRYVGGIVGGLKTTASSFQSCFSKGKITCTNLYCGGIIGASEGACIEQMESCSHFGDISGTQYVGGLIGAVLNTVEAPVLHTYETRSSSDYSSSSHRKWYYETIKTGSSITKSVNNCTAIGNVTGKSNVGGLVGSETTADGYTSSTNNTENHAVFEGTTYLGFSYKYYTYTRNTISLNLSNSYYSGTIHGTDNVGGLYGHKSGGTIQNNYSYANLYGSSNVAGVVGYVSDGKINNSSNTTTIKSNVANNPIISATSANIGRVYGNIDNSCTVIGALGSAEGNRALAQTKLILQGVVQEVEDNLQEGTSIGPSLLKLKATYVSMGWNFDENWDILETECYPYKKYQAAPPVIESNLVSQATSISGKSINGGTVYLYYKDRDAVSTECEGYQWTFTTEPLQSGAQVQIYADVEGMTPSYYSTTTVGYPGSGTEADPWRIYTAEDLQGACNRGYYKVMNNIDLTQWINENSPTKGWIAVGRNSGEATYIDGDGHKITGLWIEAPEENFTGLFSNFSAGQIKNLNVEVATGKKVHGADYTGILIGRNANGRLVNCSVKGDVEGIGHVGGLAGYAENTTISAITVEASITGTTYVGGVAGQSINCTMTTCNASTTIVSSGSNSNVGGLVGNARGGTISKCTAENSLTAADESNYVGGLVGYSESPVSLSFSAGNVTATGSDSYSGGLVGYALSPIENCYSKANTNGTQFTAALVGYTFSSIDKCYAKGNVNGVMYGGGVVGELDGPTASISNSIACCNTLSLTAQSSWGSRVIGGFKNGAAEPGNNNYALSTMQVSLNNVPQTKTDDSVEGIAKTKAELKTAQTYMDLGWNFSEVWGIEEGERYPYLLWEIDVNPVADISFDKTTMLIAVGKSETINASVLPLGATNKRLEWTSSNTAVATVTDGVVTAVAVGTATITASSTDGSNISATCAVTVTANHDDAIAVLQTIVDRAQALYDNSVEGENIGEYASGARAELLAVINSVNARISSTMSSETISQCTNEINAAIELFQSKKVTAGEDTDISSMNNVIYLNKVEASADSQINLSIRMKNTAAIRGFQFDIYLPDGVTVVKSAKGKIIGSLSEGRLPEDDEHSLTLSEQGDGAIRFLCGSLYDETFTGNDGEIATLTVKVAEKMNDGDYPIILRNMKLTETDINNYYQTDYVKSTLTIKSYTLGDINNDQKIDVSDYIGIANHILGNTPEGFVFAAADVNLDGNIDVSDYIGVANIILTGSIYGGTSNAAMMNIFEKEETQDVEPE